MPKSNMQPDSTPPIAELVVYYDAACPVCRREVAHYQRLPAQRPVSWQDANVCQFGDSGLDCETALRRFHVRSADGRLYSGAAAFSVLWRCLPGWRWLGWACAVPPFSWMAEGGYRVFLRFRPRLQAWARKVSGERKA
jgi:predicted DCC family thiol-disulfide oxidoreductase YuxK